MSALQLNRPIIITGCHRSGTTLFGLMLDSHPLVTLIDEDDFDNSKLADYMEGPGYRPDVAFKLPAEALNFRAFKALPGLKVIWCVRDPRDVVLSLHNLRWVHAADRQYVPMSAHDLGCMLEIGRYLAAIDPQCAHPGVAEYRRISAIPQQFRTRRDAILMGALYWELKNMLPPLYAAEGVPVHMVVYEKLITRPRETMEQVLDFLELPWHGDVLRHHELHAGRYAGNTMGDRPIDPTNAGKWKAGLSPEEAGIVQSYCAQGMAKFAYVQAGHLPTLATSAYASLASLRGAGRHA